MQNVREARGWRLGPHSMVQAHAQDPLAEAMDAIFGALRCKPTASALSLKSLQKDGTLVITLGGVVLARTPELSRIAPLLEPLMLSAAIRARERCIPLRASALAIEAGPQAQVALLLPSEQEPPQKLLLELCALELRYISGDLTFLCEKDLRPEPFHKALALPAQRHSPKVSDRAWRADSGEIRYVLPQRLCTDATISSPSVVLLAKHDPNCAELQIRRMPPQTLSTSLRRASEAPAQDEPLPTSVMARLMTRPRFILRYARAAQVQSWLLQSFKNQGDCDIRLTSL